MTTKNIETELNLQELKENFQLRKAEIKRKAKLIELGLKRSPTRK